jgi:hypothetical protein
MAERVAYGNAELTRGGYRLKRRPLARTAARSLCTSDMSILSDLLSELVETVVQGALWPSTARGELVLLAVGGLCLSSVNGWLLLSSPNPLNEQWWGFGVIAVVGIISGTMAAFLSGLHLVRGADHRLLAGVAVALNLGAVVISLTLML